jgi:hypothetical protein
VAENREASAMVLLIFIKTEGTMGKNDDLKVISLDASTVRIPVEPLGAVTEDELNKRIHELFVKYCCGGIDKPEDEMPHYVKVCREVFTNGYKAGYQDMLRNVTGKEWEK